MSEPPHTTPARRPGGPRTRERLREVHAAETRAVAAVCGAEAKVTSATMRRDKARADLAAVSGVDRAALLLGISTSELRRSVASASGRDGAA